MYRRSRKVVREERENCQLDLYRELVAFVKKCHETTPTPESKDLLKQARLADRGLFDSFEWRKNRLKVGDLPPTGDAEKEKED